MNYFTDCLTIEQVKERFRTLTMTMHPDHGGTDAQFIELMTERDARITVLAHRQANDRMGTDAPDFVTEILAKVIDLNCRIELIGTWVYAFDAYAVKDVLKGLGFWFSAKHKAWIFNGGEKARIRTGLTTDQVRQMHGAQEVKTKRQTAQIG
jgi:hypothetical protein